MDESLPENRNASDLDRKARQVEILISNLLRIGVVASLLVIIAGECVTFLHHPQYLHSKTDLTRLTTPSRGDFPHTPGELIVGLGHGQGRAVVVAGLLLLIATPVMRVAVSIFAFVYEKDPAFVVITSIVLALLLFSFFLGNVTA